MDRIISISVVSAVIAIFTLPGLALLVRLTMRKVFRQESKLYAKEMREGLTLRDGAPIPKERIVSGLGSVFWEAGFFPTYLKVCIDGDPRYSLKAMGEDFLRDRDIRWLVALFALPQVFGKKEKPDPFSIPIAPGQAMIARMDFCLFNALIAESLLRFSEREAVNVRLREACREMVDEVIASLLSPPGGFHPPNAYLYKVSFDPRIRNPSLNAMMTDWSAYYDSDSSAYALSLFGRYLRARRSDDRFLDLTARVGTALAETTYLGNLEAVFRPAAEFTLPAGRESLPDGARAFLTYFTTGANDADPVVNMDILEALARNFAIWNLADRPGLLSMAAGALDYIRCLAVNGSIFEPEVNQYYTAPAGAFLWKRYYAAYQELDPGQRLMLDPEEATAAIDAAMETHWDIYSTADPGLTKPAGMDLALLANAFPARSAFASSLAVKMSAAPECHEFFCAVYPVKVVYGSPHLMSALALESLHDA